MLTLDGECGQSVPRTKYQKKMMQKINGFGLGQGKCNLSVHTEYTHCLPSGTKFLRVLIFAFFPAIRKNKFPQIKVTANIFPAKICSRVNAL